MKRKKFEVLFQIQLINLFKNYLLTLKVKLLLNKGHLPYLRVDRVSS